MENEENYEPQALRIEDKTSGQDEGVTIAYLSAGIDLDEPRLGSYYPFSYTGNPVEDAEEEAYLNKWDRYNELMGEEMDNQSEKEIAREFIRREGVVIPDPECEASKQFFAEKPGKMGTVMIIVLVFGGVYIGTALASWATSPAEAELMDLYALRNTIFIFLICTSLSLFNLCAVVWLRLNRERKNNTTDDDDDEESEKCVAAWPCPYYGCTELETVTSVKDEYAYVECQKCESSGPVIRRFPGHVPETKVMQKMAIEAWDRRLR